MIDLRSDTVTRPTESMLDAMTNQIGIRVDVQPGDDLSKHINDGSEKHIAKNVLPVESNIVVFELVDDFDSKQYLRHLEQQGVLAMDLSERTIRFVFHLDTSDSQFETILRAIAAFGE